MVEMSPAALPVTMAVARATMSKHLPLNVSQLAVAVEWHAVAMEWHAVPLSDRQSASASVFMSATDGTEP